MVNHEPKPNRNGQQQFETTVVHNERAAAAARLRAKGWSYPQIAKELGYADRSGAYRAVQRVLEETIQEPGDELRTLELERLNEMYKAAMDVLERGHVTVSHGKIVTLDDVPLRDDAPTLQAIDRLLKIQERRAKLLGLDAATKTEVGGSVKYEIVGIDVNDLK